jgi:D-alanyl-D-alanine dipeptidase
MGIRYLSWCLAASFALLTACASPPPANTSERAESPPTEKIRGVLLRDSSLFPEARSWAASSLCTARKGSVFIHRFRAGRFFVELTSSEQCGVNVSVKEGWVDATDVDFDDTALAPLLTRVKESANLRINMNYAGNKIFCDSGTCKINEPLYGKNRCYVAPPVAEGLMRAAQSLAQRDPSARLLLLDCYRPIAVQIEMFERVSDPVWVARPEPPRYGGHNRGVAIDLTIERNGVAVNMGSAFDVFNDVSNYDPKVVNAEAHGNRTLLREAMIAAGFRPYDAEWWHFWLPMEARAMNFPL